MLKAETERREKEWIKYQVETKLYQKLCKTYLEVL
jgi:hypothetical protein